MTREPAMGDQVHEGGCLCGTVRIRAWGEPFGAPYCHCRDCRKSTSAPVSLLVGYAERQVESVSGDPKVYESSPGVRRAFCGDCGTSITYKDDRLPGEVYIHVGVFDDPASFEPTIHSWYSQRLEYLNILDDLPRPRESSRSR